MPTSIIACLVFILSHAVIAQADFTPAPAAGARLSSHRWQATHEGNGTFEEKAVHATLEVSEVRYEVPDALAGRLNTFISIEPSTKKTYRLHLTTGAQAELRADYALEPKLLSGENAFREGFVSAPALHQEYCLLMLPLDGGGYRVIAKKKSDQTVVAEFAIDPVAL